MDEVAINSKEYARQRLEGLGVPVTSTLWVVISDAVELFFYRRRIDRNISRQQLVREVANNVVTKVGLRDSVYIVWENERLRASRKASSAERPTNPSVEDLSTEIVKDIIVQVLSKVES